eukprot:GGOE01041195.1.p1 GENE.GGOE01041195.1~~GGOE01041195.1.p1  ORF type:complete len:586 (-),score=223.84 GGOE01041195.1:315-2024(-)
MAPAATTKGWAWLAFAAAAIGALLFLHFQRPKQDFILAIHLGAHDNTLVISRGPVIELVLELERIFGVRYFEKSHEEHEFTKQWTKALEVAKKVVAPGLLDEHLRFKKAIVVETYASTLKPWMLATLRTVVYADAWLERPHALSHATHAFYDSGFSSALVVTADADEHDGAFNVWWGTRSGGIVSLETMKLNIALAYEYVGAAMDEMNSGKRDEKCWKDHPLHCNKYAGTLMGYSALGHPSKQWKEKLRPLFLANTTAEKNRIIKQLTPFPSQPAVQREISASAQALLEEYLIRHITWHAGRLQPSSGIVLGGDLALNVKANSAVQGHFKRPVWVPSNPGDDGVAVGAIWMEARPHKRQELMYLGLPLLDLEELPAYAEKYNAKDASPELVSGLLLKEQVVGIVVGRQEVGPRALGHRSLFAIPTSQKMKDRLNTIKVRQWFRPVAPTMNAEAVPVLFEDDTVVSPYMSFAPKLKPGADKQYPAIAHYDGSARPQTVTREANPWLYELLNLVAKGIGQPVVINTSFNTKGKPIINTIKEVIELLKILPDLDHVYVEGKLFSREEVLKVK